MRISTLLDHIDSGHMALPEFQRGYVWNRDQVRGLFDSLYKRHPVGGLLVWATEAKTAVHRGDGPLSAGVVKLLLDGQQRITSLYGVTRGRPPNFFDGNAQAFTELRFHLEDEVFGFYQPVKMRGDARWIDVTALMKAGNGGMGVMITQLSANPEIAPKVGEYVSRLSRLLGILEIDFHVDEITGADKTLEVVVDIFNKVNSGGTKLSKGDLALAKICADWPDARDTMQAKLRDWAEDGYEFNLDWLLRSVNTVLTGEAKFQFLHNRKAEEVQEALGRAIRRIDTCLNLISGRLGLDHARVLFGRFAIPVMVRYLDQRSGVLDEVERDKLLFWFANAGMWGRYSGSTESMLDQDLAALEGPDGGLDKMLKQLQVWSGGLWAEPENFESSSLGARFYPVLYLLTRMGEARDWGTGIPLKANLRGKMNKLEVHHIFPKAQLYKRDYGRSEVNALANFCFLTKDTNLDITDRLPEEYFPKIEAAHPGALKSQWVPEDPKLWKIANYPEFLKARQALLADALNERMKELLHGDDRWLDEVKDGDEPQVAAPEVAGSILDEEEEAQLVELNAWVEQQGLAAGELSYDLADPETGQQLAVLDLAWPQGLQAELTEPVTLLLNEPNQTAAVANEAGFRCFRSVDAFKAYVEKEILITE